MVVIILGAVGFFYPKIVGGPLCGPVCFRLGLHKWETGCLGFQKYHTCPDMGLKEFLTEWLFNDKRTCLDTFATYCFGLAIGEKRCYGMSYTDTNESNFEDREISCDYPCNDKEIEMMCREKETLTFDGTTLICKALKEKCGW